MADLSDNVNWFEIDNSNNKASPNGWPEGMMPSGVNDSARADKGALKRFWDRINPVQVVTPAGGVWTFTTSNPAYPASYVEGEIYTFYANGSSVGGDQFQVNGLGLKPITKFDAGSGVFGPIAAQDISPGPAPQLVYNQGLNAGSGGFFLLNPHLPISNSGSGGVTLSGPISTTGPNGGFYFYDHTTPSIGWTWYAYGGFARLYSSGDKITIDTGGNLHAAGNVTAGGNVSGAGLFLTAGIYFNGTVFATSDGTTSHIYDGTGGNAIHLQAANNYYDADLHTFRNNAGAVNLLNLDGLGVTLNGPFIHFVGSSGSINTTGGPLIYADNSNHVYKQGSGNGSWLFQNYAGAIVANLNSAGTLSLTGAVSASSVQVSGPNAVYGFSDRDGVSQPWSWYATGGIARLWNGTNSDRVQVDSGGSAAFTGYLSSAGHVTRAGIAGAVTGNHFNIEWRSGAHLWIDSAYQGAFVLDGGGGIGTSSIAASGSIYSAGGYTMTDPAGGNNFGIFSSGNYGYIRFLPTWYWQFNYTSPPDPGSGTMVWTADGIQFWAMRNSDGVCANYKGSVAGLGAYVNTSDRRGKKNIVPSLRGLSEILELSPVEFDRVSSVETPREIGFVAQDVRGVLPEAVRVVGIPLPDGTGGLDDAEPTLGLADATIVAALVNAVKTLNARIAQLEGK